MSENSTEQQTEGTDTGTESKTEVTLDDLQSALKDLGLTPGQIKGRLDASKKWESRAKERSNYDELKAENEKLRTANMSATEKELEKLRTDAHATGVAEARATYGSQLVQAKFEGMLTGRGVEAERAAVLSQHLSTGTYLADDGTVDTEALSAYVDAGWPSSSNGTGRPEAILGAAAFGAGQRASTTATPGALGLAEALKRFPKTKSA